jgi:energy-coupling factor transporter ATP-binding protein EcfA2
MTFQKASKAKSKLRLALFGPSGAGKTFSALRLATGIVTKAGGKIAVIDSERDSSSLYADKFEFDNVSLVKKDIEEYVNFIDMAAKQNYSVLIIDSLTHAWQELLEDIDRVAKAKYRGNTWSAWSDGTPKQKRLINALLSFPGHIIATMRVKTEWILSEKNGKSVPERVGLAPEQGKGIEYEFTILGEITPDHTCFISKDRTGKYQDKILKCIDESFGEELIEWLNTGIEPKPIAPLPEEKKDSSNDAKPTEEKKDYTKEVAKLKTLEKLAEWWNKLTYGQKNDAIEAKNKRKSELEAETKEKAGNPNNVAGPKEFYNRLLNNITEKSTIEELEKVDRLMEEMPSDDPDRKYYVEEFEKIIAARNLNYSIVATPF